MPLHINHRDNILDDPASDHLNGNGQVIPHRPGHQRVFPIGRDSDFTQVGHSVAHRDLVDIPVSKINHVGQRHRVGDVGPPRGDHRGRHQILIIGGDRQGDRLTSDIECPQMFPRLGIDLPDIVVELMRDIDPCSAVMFSHRQTRWCMSDRVNRADCRLLLGHLGERNHRQRPRRPASDHRQLFFPGEKDHTGRLKWKAEKNMGGLAFCVGDPKPARTLLQDKKPRTVG